MYTHMFVSYVMYMKLELNVTGSVTNVERDIKMVVGGGGVFVFGKSYRTPCCSMGFWTLS